MPPPPLNSVDVKEATAQLSAGGGGQHASLGRMREDEMCQLAEVKQEPSLVSNTFFKQARGSCIGTPLKALSLPQGSQIPKTLHSCLQPGKASSHISLEGLP